MDLSGSNGWSGYGVNIILTDSMDVVVDDVAVLNVEQLIIKRIK